MKDFQINPDLDLVLSRYVPVSPEKVWRAWTTPALLEQWFCPKPWRAGDFEIDLRPGGAFNCTMYGPAGEVMPNRGCFLEVVPGRRMVTTDALHAGYRPSGSAFMSAIWSCEPEGEGTRYVAIAIHGNPETRKQHLDMGFHEGWGAAADQLVELMQRTP